MSEQSRARLLVPLAALSLVVLAGCGGGGSTAAAAAGAGGASGGASTTVAGSAANGVPVEMQAYVACLKQHGVDLPANGRFFGSRNGQAGQSGQGEASSPPSSFQLGNSSAPASSPSIDRAKLQAARDACADLLPEGATFGDGFTGRAGGADASAFNAYRSCMADHGVTIGGQNGGAPVSIDRTSDTFKSANAVCAPLLPNGGQGFGTQGTTP